MTEDVPLVHPCKRCGMAERPIGEKFCKQCRKDAVDEMRRSGYFQWVPPLYPSCCRSGDQKQAMETNDSNPWQENAVRALEDW